MTSWWSSSAKDTDWLNRTLPRYRRFSFPPSARSRAGFPGIISSLDGGFAMDLEGTSVTPETATVPGPVWADTDPGGASHTDSRQEWPRQRSLELRFLLRLHFFDWATCLLLLVLWLLLLPLHPYEQYISAHDLAFLGKPLLPNSVPAWCVPILGLAVPLLAISFIGIHNRNLCDLHEAVLGLWTSILFTAVTTDATKLFIGRPRPDFLWRCFPNGTAVFGSDGNVLCSGLATQIMEGRKSFPSGHTSWCFSGLVFLSLYFLGKLRALTPSTVVLWRTTVALLPIAVATAVGFSRVVDYWHFPTDAIAGATLGTLFSALAYFHLYPALSSKLCHIPRVLLAVPGDQPAGHGAEDSLVRHMDGEPC